MKPFIAFCWASLALVVTATAAADARLSGAQLYIQHCSACHGESGGGGVGVPLALPAFLAAANDEYLSRTIRMGRPGRVMPAFAQLSDAEVGAIVGHIRSWHPQAPVPITAPVVGDADHGKTLFDQHCVACHGADGGGGHGTGVTFSRPRDLPVVAPALNNTGFLAAASDAMIKHSVLQGREGTPMPSAAQLGLAESDVNDLVAYIRSFERRASGRGDAPEMAPVLVYESSYDLQETIDNVKRAAVGRNFRIIREQFLDQGLVAEGEEDTRRVMVYFCNFKFLDDVLKIDPRVGLFLPCRVTVVQQGERVLVMTINPKRLSYLFNNRELDAACDEMTELYESILEESTL